MGRWLFLPPVAFGLLCLAVAALSFATRKLAAHGADSEGKRKAYACGEQPATNRVQPSYGEFFPVAFFFIIMHVVTLILATVPRAGIRNLIGIITLYLVAAFSGLFILFGDRIQHDLKELWR